MSRILSAMLLVVTLAAPQVGAANGLDTLAKGPGVGTSVPLSLSARDQEGKSRDIKSLARRRGLVLLFSRSLDW